MSPSTQTLPPALPPRTTARDLFLDACARAKTGVMFMGEPDAPRQWWNWYMTTPQWEHYFRLQTVPGKLRLDRPEQYPTARRAAVLPDSARRPVGDDAPGAWTKSAHAFMFAVTAVLTQAGCPHLRGMQYTV